MSMVENTNPEESRDGGALNPGGRPRRARPDWIESRDLFGDKDEVVIRHGDQMYRLKITRYGRLILNK